MSSKPLTHNQELWIQALESDEFTQTQGALHRLEPMKQGQVIKPAGNCCLGVGANIAMRNGVKVRTEDKKSVLGNLQRYFEGFNGLLPVHVASWLGLNGTAQTDLINLNDSQKKSFKEIAAELRAHPEVYFV